MTHYQPTAELRGLVQAACNETLTPDEQARLEELMRGDADAKQFYLEYFQLHGDLYLAASSWCVLRAARQATQRASAAPRPTAARMWAAGINYISTPGRFGLFVASISTISLILTLAASPWSSPKAVEQPRRAAPPTFASVSAEVASRWLPQSAAQSVGASLRSGQTLELALGWAEVQFDCGAKILLEGPARLIVQSPRSAFLDRGRIVCRAEGPAEGFAIHTAQAEVVDLGTEFGVAVDESQTTEVHVFEGAVQVLVPYAQAPRRLVAGEAIRITPPPDPAGKVNLQTIDLSAGAFVRTSQPQTLTTPRRDRSLASFFKKPRIAYQVPSNVMGNQSYSGSLGMDFDVAAPIEVLALGAFDHQGDGFASNTTITVELWRRQNNATLFDPGDDSPGEMAAQRQFTAATSGKLQGGSRFLPLDPPLKLEAGSYTIVARGFNGQDPLANAGGGSPAWTVDDGHGWLHFLGLSRYGDEFPMRVDGHPYQYAAGTFEFRPIILRSATPQGEEGSP